MVGSALIISGVELASGTIGSTLGIAVAVGFVCLTRLFTLVELEKVAWVVGNVSGSMDLTILGVLDGGLTIIMLGALVVVCWSRI